MPHTNDFHSALIDYLVERKFKHSGDMPCPSFEHWRENRTVTVDDFFPPDEDEAAYKAELQQKSPVELQEILVATQETEAAYQREWDKLEDQARFFNAPAARADLDHWSRMTRWTLEEATALSFGKAPELVDWANIRPHFGESSFAEIFSQRRNLLYRAKDAGDLPDPVWPAEFIAWAETAGVPLPPELIEAVRVAAGRIEDRQSLIAERDMLVEKVKRLQQEAAKEKQPTARERQSLLKLLRGMAIAKYRCGPGEPRHGVAKAISDDVSGAGLSIDEDTVLKWLRAAVNETELTQ